MASSLATLSARVTGFDYSTFHAYTTVVTLEGARWTLAIRYSKFLALYEQLRAAERAFQFDFPPKGGFFFSPKPADRQVRLDAFLQAATAFYAHKKRPEKVAKLLRDFLQVDKSFKKAQKIKQDEEQTASDEPVEEPQPKEKLSDKAQEGKKALVNAAFGAAVVAAIKDNAVDAKKVEAEPKKETKVEEVQVEKKEVKVEETKVEEVKVETKAEEKKEVKVEETKIAETKVEETKVEETKIAETKVEETKVEEPKIEVKKEEKEVEEVKIQEPKAEVKIEEKKEEAKVEEPKVEVKIEKKETKVEEKKVEEVKPVTTTTTTTSTATATIVETNVESQPTANKTVVGKTVTITSKSNDTHTVKVEMTEKKASVVTLSSAAKQMAEAAEQKPKKKKRSHRKKSISQAPISSASSDGFESPDGVDDVARVSESTHLSDAQKKARNQRRKEKRKKNQKKIRGRDLKA